MQGAKVKSKHHEALCSDKVIFLMVQADAWRSGLEQWLPAQGLRLSTSPRMRLAWPVHAWQ